MKKFEGNSNAMIIGAVAGTVLTGITVVIAVSLKTGVAGAVLAVLLIAVAAVSGWLVGMQYRTRESNYIAYQRGYREGKAANTTIIQQPPIYRCTLVVDEIVNR